MAENILTKIIDKKKQKLEELKKTLSIDSLNKKIDENINYFDFKEKIEKNVKLIIKKGSHISRFTHINAFNKVIIEEDVLIAENVYLGDTDHKNSIKDMPIIKQGNEIKGEVMENIK